MIGLYLLTTTQLEISQTIKFGMSMRIEYRWIDYLIIFGDSRYVYYYEFLDNLQREDIIIIESKILKIHKNERNYNYQTEYFNCTDYNKFHQSIIDVLKKQNIKYKVHDMHNFDKINYDNKPENFNIINKLTPRLDQELIIDKSYNYFQINDKGMLILMCGVGKTLISLWITQKLNLSKIIIGVPNKLLVKQWSIEIKKIFPNINFLLVKGGITIEDIEEFLINNKSFIIITTYSSCHKVLSASKNINIIFDMKINDECHHLTSSNMKLENTTKTYVEMLNIKSSKQLSLTATLKNLETTNTDISDISIVSNDNIKYFGEIIDRKCLLWAINENIICDYIIQTISTDEEQLEEDFKNFNIIEEIDKILFLGAYATLKSIFDDNSHHLLIYSNTKQNSTKLINYINILINDKYFDIPNLYFSNYISDMKTKEQTDIIDKFHKAQFGIITCVYCLGEGWDFPKLDGVVIAENMTANIRIVQSTLRASRKNKDEPSKITKIILPILNRENWLENNHNNDLKKVREVIYQMGLEDETIMTKVKVYKFPINKAGKKKNNTTNSINISDYYNEELTQSLRLKTIPRHALDITYEKARKIIQEKNIKINNKDYYYELCAKDYRLPLKPDERFKGHFDWIYYLSIERIYYEVDKCKEMIDIYVKQNSEIKKQYLNLALVCHELCKLDNMFPPNGLWAEYYKIKGLNDRPICIDNLPI